MVFAQTPGCEVKSYCRHSKDSKTNDLFTDTDEAEILADVNLLLSIWLCRIGAGNEDCSDKLKS